MIDADKMEFNKSMLSVGEIYSKEITKPLLRIYYAALREYTIDQVTGALMAHIRSTDKQASFFPRPSDLIRQISNPDKLAKDISDSAERAWASIVEAIGRIGSYGTLNLKDRRAMDSVRSIGGWVNLTMCTYNELDWKKKEFMSAYRANVTPLEALPSSLPGLEDLSKVKQNEKIAVKKILDGLEQYKSDVNKSDDY